MSGTTFLRRFNNLSVNSQVVIAVLGTTAVTTVALLSGQALRRHALRSKLRDEVEHRVKPKRRGDTTTLGEDDDEDEAEEMQDFSHDGASSPVLDGSRVSDNRGKGKGKRKQTSEVIIRESLARNYVFFGDEGMAKIRSSFVVVVGLGGVGSAVATMLVRSGVRKIRLIDFDQVSLSSLNRHATATLAQVGTPKVTSCAEHFEAIAPWVEVDARIELFGKDVADDLLEGSPDYVIDCIDNIDSKVDLLAYCHERGIPVFASLGAGAKSDPSTIQISDISDTFEDPLAKSVRRRLKLRGIQRGIPVVYSTEKPRSDIALLPLPDEEFEKGKVGELSSLANFRVRILPVMGPLPAMFGNATAAYVLASIAGFPTEPLPLKSKRKVAQGIHRQLGLLELKLTGRAKIDLNEDDVLFLFEEVNRTRSVVPPFISPGKGQAVMMPWRKDRGIAWDNLALFDREEGQRHEEHCLDGNEDPARYWGREVAERVQARLTEARRLQQFRLH